VPNLHLTGVQAGEHATRAGIDRLIVTHVPPWGSRDDAVAEASSTFGGSVQAAQPGAVFHV
jgi:ribonuclease BN (tRNA processing enzyme)